MKFRKFWRARALRKIKWSVCVFADVVSAVKLTLYTILYNDISYGEDEERCTSSWCALKLARVTLKCSIFITAVSSLQLKVSNSNISCFRAWGTERESKTVGNKLHSFWSWFARIRAFLCSVNEKNILDLPPEDHFCRALLLEGTKFTQQMNWRSPLMAKYAHYCFK